VVGLDHIVRIFHLSMPVQIDPFAANLPVRLMDQPVQERIHVERMLACAERFSRQIAKQVDR